MSSTKNKGNALGAKTARACDSCIRNRARWYCAADDAFLCQACDSSVHSANLLARRHHRVCLKIVSYNNTNKNSSSGISNIRAPSWHKGFTKKPRTPRHGKKRAHKALKSPFDVVVPEVCPEDTNSNSHEESVNQLLYRVPATPSPEEGKNDLLGCESEFEIAEFGAEVESLLGEGLESECVGMEELGLVDTKKLEEYGSRDCCVDGGNVKVEESQQVALKENDEQKRKKMLLLRLDYEAVISAWTHQKSPWTTGAKPDLGTHQCWPHCMGTCGVELQHPCGEMGGLLEKAMADGGREARVLRYREKRRTRLFSKKIRYEVRKLNAEKRPRMKGRFVKRLH